MQKRKIWIVSTIAIALILVIAILIKQKGEEKFVEYIPEQEISEEQTRQTLVTLYFKSKEVEGIMPEARLLDAKELLGNPYMTLVNMLVGGPKNESLERLIPEGVKVNSAELVKETVKLDLSEDFVQIGFGKEKEKQIVQSIVYTLLELIEVSSVQITINGEESKGFADNGLSLETVFTKEDKE